MKGLATRLLLTACACLLARSAFADPSVHLHIQPQPLGNALNSYALQTNQQVMFAVSDQTQRPAPGLEGVYTPESALKELLAGSTLGYEFINERTVAIRPRAAINASPGVAAPSSRESVATNISSVGKPSSQSSFVDGVLQRVLMIWAARTVASATPLAIGPLTLLIFAIVAWYLGRLLLLALDKRGGAADPSVQAAHDAIDRLPTVAERRREQRRLVRALIRRAGRPQVRPVIHRILDIVERRRR